MFTPIVTVPLLSLTSFYTIDTVTLVWNTKKLVTYTLPFNSPSLRKASRSNPHALFSNCMQNDVTSVHHSRSKTNKCILLRPTNNKDMKWDSCIQLLFSCRNWSAKKQMYTTETYQNPFAPSASSEWKFSVILVTSCQPFNITNWRRSNILFLFVFYLRVNSIKFYFLPLNSIKLSLFTANSVMN